MMGDDDPNMSRKGLEPSEPQNRKKKTEALNAGEFKHSFSLQL